MRQQRRDGIHAAPEQTGYLVSDSDPGFPGHGTYFFFGHQVRPCTQESHVGPAQAQGKRWFNNMHNPESSTWADERPARDRADMRRHAKENRGPVSGPTKTTGAFLLGEGMWIVPGSFTDRPVVGPRRYVPSLVPPAVLGAVDGNTPPCPLRDNPRNVAHLQIRTRTGPPHSKRDHRMMCCGRCPELLTNRPSVPLRVCVNTPT